MIDGFFTIFAIIVITALVACIFVIGTVLYLSFLLIYTVCVSVIGLVSAVVYGSKALCR